MGNAVEQQILHSTELFEEFAWPKIRGFMGGGELVKVESVTDNSFCRELDIRGGIDRWHLMGDGEGIRGIASRMQELRPGAKLFRSFTVRYARRSGLATEFHKRTVSLDANPPVLGPQWVVQGYVQSGELVAVGVVCADSFYRYVRDMVERLPTRTNPKDGTEFKIVWWNSLQTFPPGELYTWVKNANAT